MPAAANGMKCPRRLSSVRYQYHPPVSLTLPLQQHSLRYVAMQVQYAMELSHDNIVQLLDIFTDNTHFVIVVGPKYAWIVLQEIGQLAMHDAPMSNTSVLLLLLCKPFLYMHVMWCVQHDGLIPLPAHKHGCISQLAHRYVHPNLYCDSNRTAHQPCCLCSGS